MRWELAACLLFAWIIVYFALWKSVRSSGRVLYFTATLPFILVLAFLGRSLTLEGADVGLDFLFTPNWHLLKDSKVCSIDTTSCNILKLFLKIKNIFIFYRFGYMQLHKISIASVSHMVELLHFPATTNKKTRYYQIHC